MCETNQKCVKLRKENAELKGAIKDLHQILSDLANKPEERIKHPALKSYDFDFHQREFFAELSKTVFSMYGEKVYSKSELIDLTKFNKIKKNH